VPHKQQTEITKTATMYCSNQWTDTSAQANLPRRWYWQPPA